MSHRDYCEQMQEDAAKHKAYMEENSTEHRNRKNPILSSAGETKSKRKELRKKNPDNTALFDQTYQQMDDKSMRDKFHSDDINVLTAMAIASKKVAEDNNINANNLEELDAKLLKKSNFNEHYNAAIQDIKDGVITPKYANDYYTDSGLDKIEEDRNNSDLTKSLKSKGKNNLVEKIVGCDKKRCQLDTFKISEVSKSTNIENWLNGEGKLNPSKRAGNKVNAILNKIFLDDEKDKPADKKLILDIINNDKNIDEIHIVAGNLTHFKRYFDIEVNGQCGHGYEDTCPTLKITSDKVKHVEGLSDRLPHFKKDSKALNEFNLSSQPAYDASEHNSFKAALSLLKMNAFNKDQTYSFFLESCSGSDHYLYRDFTPAIVVHQPIILKSSMKFEWDQTNRTIKPSMELIARLDKDTYKCALGASEIKNGYTELLGEGISKAVEYAGIVYGKLSNLDKTDQLECEAELENTKEAADDDSYEFLPPCINISYLMKRVDQPALNYSETAMLQSVFISASPFIKYQKTINLKTVMWRSSANYVARAALAAATSGLSEVAVAAVNHTEIGENIANSFTNKYHLVHSYIAKVAKDNKFYKSLDSDSIDAGVQESEDTSKDNEEAISISDCNEVTEDKVGTTFSCDLKVSAALETDDPSAGLVFTKRPEGKFYDFDSDSSTSSIYGGLNFSVESKLSSDMNILKCVGMGNQFLEVKEAGLKANALSADKTGESRLGFTFRYLTQKRKNDEIAKKEKASKDPNIEYDQELIDAPIGLCYQVFYSGLSVYIEAFVTFTKSESGDDKKTITEPEKSEPAPTPARSGFNQKKTKSNSFSLKADKQKTLINLRILPARESKYYAVKSPLKIGNTDKIASE